MPYQYDKLRGRIVERYANALGLSSNSVSKK